MTKPDIFIFGDSHANALYKGKTEAVAENANCAFRDWKIFPVDSGFIVDHLGLMLKDGQSLLNPVFESALINNAKILELYTKRNLLADRAHELVLVFGYIEMHRLCFFPKWAHHTVLGAEPEPSGTALPIEMIYEFLQWRMKSYKHAVKLLCELGFKISLMAGPPPVPNESYIREKSPNFQTIMAANSRLAIYGALDRAIGSIAKDAGISWRNYSAAVADADGFLARKYWADGVHGNPAYGGMILKCLHADLCGA